MSRHPTPRPHCAFRMPRNPKYQCARAGKMYQAHSHIWYCAFHDRYAKSRCQAYLEFQGSGMQCVELGSLVQEGTGRRVCKGHYAGVRMRDLDEEGGFGEAGSSEGVSGEVLVEGGIVEVGEEGQEESDSDSDMESTATDLPIDDVATTQTIGPHFNRDLPTKPSESESQESPARDPPIKDIATVQIIRPHSNRDIPTKPSESESQESPATDPPIKDIATVQIIRPHSNRNLPTEPPESESESQRIAAMYVQCNICLEKHTVSSMEKVTPCGHQYSDSCLQELRRRGSVRRYNCSSCRAWVTRCWGEGSPE